MLGRPGGCDGGDGDDRSTRSMLKNNPRCNIVRQEVRSCCASRTASPCGPTSSTLHQWVNTFVYFTKNDGELDVLYQKWFHQRCPTCRPSRAGCVRLRSLTRSICPLLWRLSLRGWAERVWLRGQHPNDRSPRMDIHENARTTRHSRMLIVERLAGGWALADVAAAHGVTPKTVRKWRDRHARRRCGGVCLTRSSRPHRSPSRLDSMTEDAIEVLRRQRLSGPAIARKLGRPVSTIGQGAAPTCLEPFVGSRSPPAHHPLRA